MSKTVGESLTMSETVGRSLTMSVIVGKSDYFSDCGRESMSVTVGESLCQ